MAEMLAVGVDLGATKTAAGLVARDGQVLATRHVPTLAADGVDAVIERIAGLVRELIGEAPGKILGVGIGSPGVVDSARGIVFGAVNLPGWDEVQLAQILTRQIRNLPVVVENDANAAAVGEGYFGSAKGSRDYACLTVGSGLGSAVISDGRLVTGAHFVGTDLGHYSLDPDQGPLCICGHRGCAETICSGPGLVNLFNMQRTQSKSPSTLRSAENVTSAEIIAAARAADPIARSAVDTMGRSIGHVAAVAGAIIDPDVIIISGGLGLAAFDLMQQSIANEYARRIPSCMIIPPFRASTLTSSALGGASLVWSLLAADHTSL